jgi:histidine triad (HIT) family protein
MIADCVFCKIVAGDIPCDKVYEDDLVLCFLDIAPLSLGHALIIPKEHQTSSTTLPDEVAARMFQLAPKIGQALVRATDGGGFNLLLSNGTCAGQVVPHAHLHIIPRRNDDGIVLPTESVEYESPEQKARILDKTRTRLAQ